MMNNRLVTEEQLEVLKKISEESDCSLGDIIADAVAEIKRYHRLEEEKQLTILPCKPEHWVWASKNRGPVHKVMYMCQADILHDLEHGVKIGLTQEAVEKMLEETEDEDLGY